MDRSALRRMTAGTAARSRRRTIAPRRSRLVAAAAWYSRRGVCIAQNGFASRQLSVEPSSRASLTILPLGPRSVPSPCQARAGYEPHTKCTPGRWPFSLHAQILDLLKWLLLCTVLLRPVVTSAVPAVIHDHAHGQRARAAPAQLRPSPSPAAEVAATRRPAPPGPPSAS